MISLRWKILSGMCWALITVSAQLSANSIYQLLREPTLVHRTYSPWLWRWKLGWVQGNPSICVTAHSSINSSFRQCLAYLSACLSNCVRVLTFKAATLSLLVFVFLGLLVFVVFFFGGRVLAWFTTMASPCFPHPIGSHAQDATSVPSKMSTGTAYHRCCIQLSNMISHMIGAY